MLHSIPAGTALAALKTTKCSWAGKGFICWSEIGGQQQQRMEDEAKLPWLRWERVPRAPEMRMGNAEAVVALCSLPQAEKSPPGSGTGHTQQIIRFEHPFPRGSQTRDSRVRKQGSGHPWGGGTILSTAHPRWEHSPALSGVREPFIRDTLDKSSASVRE